MADGRKQSGAERRNRARVHNRDREAEILNAARAVFERRGFDAASVAEIARVAEVAEGTIYLYCATKRDLLRRVVARWYEQLIADAAPGLATREGAEAKLRHFAERHLTALGENAALGRLLVGELRGGADDPGSALRELDAGYARRLVEVLREGVAAGEIRADARIDVARDLFFGALEHIALGGASEPGGRAEAVEAFMRLYWRAITCDGA